MFNINRYFGFIALVIVFGTIGFGGIVLSDWSMSVAPQFEVAGGDSQQGRIAVQSYGCGTCHTIPGVEGATATVGPPLTDFASRSYIAGELTNKPDNLIFFIQHPQQVNPGTDMPDLNVTTEDARNIAAYLYTLRR